MLGLKLIGLLCKVMNNVGYGLLLSQTLMAQDNNPSIDYGFRWVYLLFPFLPTLLLIKGTVVVIWHLLSALLNFFLCHDDGEDPTAAYSERRSDRIAFVIMVFALICIFLYLTRI